MEFDKFIAFFLGAGLVFAGFTAIFFVKAIPDIVPTNVTVDVPNNFGLENLTSHFWSRNFSHVISGGKVDDWEYDGRYGHENRGGVTASAGGMLQTLTSGKAMAMPMMEASDSLGFSVGGAKDINNFRENIENGYLPIPTDITYEGLFYDYYFDTGKQERCRDLFCPSYSYAKSLDPIGGNLDEYLAVGLNSNIREDDFERKKLNLVVVLDISGSMSSSFNKYYYDQFGNRMEVEDWDEKESAKQKMRVAAESVIALMDHLEDDDNFGIILFNNDAMLAKPMRLVGRTDMAAIEDHLLEVGANGGTNMAAGMKMASEMFDDLEDTDPQEYENRIIFLTDAMPNRGETSKSGLLGMAEDNADDGVYSTFIGIGVDFNTELIEHITKIRGANYYSVHSARQFDDRMDEGFEYMVTPLVFDLKLKLYADGYEIMKVYGSPEADEATGSIMRVNTLFPSKSEGGETKGGIILLKLKKLEDDATLKLKVTYEDRDGREHQSEKTVEIPQDGWNYKRYISGIEDILTERSIPNYYENDGIRKAVLLTRYADLMKNWINDERGWSAHPTEYEMKPSVREDCGIIVPMPYPQLGEWERQSMPLKVSRHYEQMFEMFTDYFEDEMREIGDRTLNQELDILEKLQDY